MSFSKVLSVLALGVGLAVSSQAAVVINNSVAGAVLNDFEAVAVGNVTGVISQTGATYAETFAGQSILPIFFGGDSFDATSGVPASPLTLQSNAVLGENVGVTSYNGSKVIYGDLAAQVGEGALSVLFGQGTDVLSFSVVGADRGSFTVRFFGVTGTLISSITQSSIVDGVFGFEANGGDLIRGVTITNMDAAGIAFDNFRFNASAVPPTSVPEPGSLALLGLGLAGLAAIRKRKQA